MIRKIRSTFERIFRKRLAYQRIFDTHKPEVKIILADLARLCPQNPVNGAGIPIDERQVFIHIGRRQVLSHMLAYIHMTDEQLNKIAREDN